MANYKKVAGGQWGAYKKEESPWGAILGWGIAILVLLGLIGSCSNDAEGQAVNTIVNK